jgi:Sec-independent protein translocase protein TatA
VGEFRKAREEFEDEIRKGGEEYENEAKKSDDDDKVTKAPGAQPRTES